MVTPEDEGDEERNAMDERFAGFWNIDVHACCVGSTGMSSMDVRSRVRSMESTGTHSQDVVPRANLEWALRMIADYLTFLCGKLWESRALSQIDTRLTDRRR